jgi:hypothetical protein
LLSLSDITGRREDGVFDAIFLFLFEFLVRARGLLPLSEGCPFHYLKTYPKLKKYSRYSTRELTAGMHHVYQAGFRIGMPDIRPGNGY